MVVNRTTIFGYDRVTKHYHIIDLKVTKTEIHVAIVPDFWHVRDVCYYPKINGEKLSKTRAYPDGKTWWWYYSTVRKTYGNVAS